VRKSVLQIIIPFTEGFDEIREEFVVFSGCTLELEHSLVSLSKWESKWEKPFLGKEKKTEEQSRDYVRMMILGDLPPEEAFSHLSAENMKTINAYIDAKMSATWFSSRQEPSASREIVTAELIYYWMIALGIPFECQHWHLNRLITLIRVCNIKNQPKTRINRTQALAQQREINAERRRATGSRG
jgi:hypothetical protein